LNYYYPELTHKATVISSGIKIPQINNLPLKRSSTILYVGARDGYKDFATLIRALPAILDFDPSIQLLAVSDKQFSQSERSYIAELGLTDNVIQRELSDSELQVAYQTSCLTVVTSKVEGFGLPVIEAMIQGCIVVASDIPVFREISENSFVAFRPGDAQDLALKITRILSDPTCQKDLREKGREVAKQYSWSNVLNALSKLYKEM
jgi:glycosyltransferase involved in cell wall biosynthesis